MSFKDVQIGLDTLLSMFPGDTPIAWENTEYKPVLGVAFLRPTLMNFDSSLLDLQSDQQDPGNYRIDAFYPINNGPRNLLDKLDAIYAHFKQNLNIQVNSTVIHIRAISILPRNITEQSWFMGSLDINFIVYENTSFSPIVGQLMWVPISISGPVTFNKGYITTNDISRVVFDLPNVCNRGDYFRIAGYGLGGWEINAPPGISIIYGDQETSNGGSLASVDPHDCIEIVCVVANQKFEELSSQGNITVT